MQACICHTYGMGVGGTQHNALPEGLGEFLSADRFVTVLQLIENPLQRQRNALARVVSLRGHHVHRLRRQQQQLARVCHELPGFSPLLCYKVKLQRRPRPL